MRIVNMMLSKDAGGIQQSFLDYGAGLTALGHDTVAVVDPRAAIRADAAGAHRTHHALANRGRWDVLAARRLRRLLDRETADIVLVHGGRALAFALRAAAGRVPIVAVSHNYRFGRLEEADAVFAITAHMKAALVKAGRVPGDRILVVPNSIAVGPIRPRPPWRTVSVVGALGRMVSKKGFDVLIDALAILQARQRSFRAIIAGDGETAAALRTQAEACGLAALIEFPGWITDRQAFLDEIDVFCLPSLHEPFGLVVLEAMAQALPIVSTATEGPSEILTDGHDALLCPGGDSKALADALAATLDDAAVAMARGHRAADTVRTRFDRAAVMSAAAQNLAAIAAGFTPSPGRHGLMVRLFG